MNTNMGGNTYMEMYKDMGKDMGKNMDNCNRPFIIEL
jgi:hypothetical protein